MIIPRLKVGKGRRRPGSSIPAVDLSATRLVKTREASRIVGLSPKTLRQLRCDEQGPGYIKTGESKQARVLYPVSALEAWVAEMVSRGN